MCSLDCNPISGNDATNTTGAAIKNLNLLHLITHLIFVFAVFDDYNILANESVDSAGPKLFANAVAVFIFIYICLFITTHLPPSIFVAVLKLFLLPCFCS